MKTYKNLFDKICDFENLHRSYLQARKCKRYRPEILAFSYDLEGNLLKLREELTNQSYRHGAYKEFVVRDPKRRVIKAAPFRDRVVHHALCNVIEPIFDKGFIYDSYACRIGKGTHRAIKRLQSFLRSLSSTCGGGGGGRSTACNAISQNILAVSIMGFFCRLFGKKLLITKLCG